MEITKIHVNNISFDQFTKEFWELEEPVIIQGVEIPEDSDLDEVDVKSIFKVKENEEYGWYNSYPKENLTPDFVLRNLERDDISKREMNFRVFMHPKGHQTLAHYDGNSVHGLNYQYKGKKEWIIISPKTPLNCIPFMYVVMEKELKELDDKFIHYKFTTSPGDLLFIPRYWQHQVTSLDDVNINFNWVVTPNYPAANVLGQREREIIKLRESFPIINKAYFPDSIDKYGGVGKSLTSNYTSSVSNFSMLKRLAYEIQNYIFLPYYFFTLKKRAKDFAQNNFNV